MNNFRFFFSENFHFLAVKFPVYLNRLVFEMESSLNKRFCSMIVGQIVNWKGG